MTSLIKLIVRQQFFAYVLAPQLPRWRIFWKVNALFIYHRNYARMSRQAAKWKSRIWQYHLSVCTAELILLLRFYLEVCFSFFFSNNSFKNIGLAITFASDWNKAEHGAFSVEGKKSSPVTTVESIMRPEKTVSLSLSTLSSLT